MATVKRILIICIIAISFIMAITCWVAYFKEIDNTIKSKDSIIIELENANNIINKELETLKNNLKTVEEEKEAVKQELDTKSKRLKEFEAVLSSSVICITLQELNLLFKIVEAEAGNETMAGKIAVANVVINRVRDKRFPNTVKEVIYQPYQFEPVSNGHINKKASVGSKEAVIRALLGERVVSNDTVIFWANYLDPSHELWELPITAQIGTHMFTNRF